MAACPDARESTWMTCHCTSCSAAIRLTLNQSPPLGNERFYARIEKLTGNRRAGGRALSVEGVADDTDERTRRERGGGTLKIR